MRGRRGIRARIAGGSLLIAILISVAAGIVINSQIERIVREGTTAVLRSDSAPYVVALETEPSEPFDAPGPSQLVAVVAPDGSTPVDSLPSPLSDMLPQLTTLERTSEADADGTPYLVKATQLQVGADEWTVVAARHAEAENTILTQMRLLLIVGLAVISAGTAVAAWLLTSISLAPVERLRTAAEELSESSTTELLPVGETNDEIAELARTLNDLVERLRASAARERQFVADASHELRTPLALVNTQLQVAIAESASVDQMLSDVRGAQRNVMRLSRLVSSLLELSEIDAVGRAGASSAPELERETADAVERARVVGADVVVSYRSFNGPWPSGLRYGVRAEDFGRLVDNLANNSLRAVRDEGSVEISLRLDGGDLTLSVADTGGGLDPAFAPTALDRFSRADASRVGSNGVGLGLAIVDAIVKSAGGDIRLDNRPGEGLTVVVVLPPIAGASE
ncbi:sensor histidine kinase [Agromyces allii]|uniref:histidine kinase n=1 Tax=Agromyces allii TaxID=393607 RepID=A0ABN2QJF5_9MICO|nr:HAMP domain-containing sensor histidine kinase [Agromyces allii]